MGKSLQGAGGSLVAGVVIKAILTRTLLYSEYQNRYPEKWLKELFIELHKVFESFDGSMLLSGFMGLIEEFTGTIYFIYAEHPYPVIYREGKAEFLDNTTEFRKFGTPGLVGKISLLVKKLEPGDILFVGSDGKDDLILSNNGQEIINEDETLFLRLVEDAKGDLEKLIEKIKQTGKLMDDISLIRISYKENQQESLNQILSLEERDKILNQVKLLSSENRWKDLKNYLEEIHQKYYNVDFVMRELINIYYKLEQYSKVITEGEQYLEAHPYDNEILLKVSRCYLITKNYEKAIELSERLDLREPNNVSNLFTLVNCYNLIGDKKRAIKVLNRLLDLAPEKEETKRLRNLILGY
jgi:tetratricopeptide (TPR) repeat protein